MIKELGYKEELLVTWISTKSVKFDLFPLSLDRKNILKNKDEWVKELDDLFCLRMNKAINEIGYAW